MRIASVWQHRLNASASSSPSASRAAGGITDTLEAQRKQAADNHRQAAEAAAIAVVDADARASGTWAAGACGEPDSGHGGTDGGTDGGADAKVAAPAAAHVRVDHELLMEDLSTSHSDGQCGTREATRQT